MQIEPNDPTLQQASELLAQMEAAEADQADASDATAQVKPGSAMQEPSAPVPGATEQVHSTDSKPNGAPATEEPQKPAEQSRDATGKFAQNQARLQGGWKTLNTEKDTLKKEREAFASQQAQFAKERTDFEAKQRTATQPKYTPQQVEEAAAAALVKADQLEAAGKFAEADKQRVQAEQFKEYAKQLRDNPPQTTEQQATAAKQAEEKFKADQKEWWSKAAIDYPESAKAGSPIALKIKAMMTPGDPAYDAEVQQTVLTSPKGLYYVARLVSAETAAASVPTKEKELVELRAKVKELEGKLSIPGDQIATQLGKPKSDSEKSDDELEAELQATAATMDRRY